jgi:nitrate/nitrite transporter NarK
LVSVIGVWAVGNIGNEEGSLWWPLGVAYAIYPLYWQNATDLSFTTMVIMAAFAFDIKAKKWRRRVKPEKSFAK